MIHSLSILPQCVRDAVEELVALPEFVKLIDMAGFNKTEGMWGGIYVVMKDGTEVWKRPYIGYEIEIMKNLKKVWDDAEDNTTGVNCTVESNPLDLVDINDYVEDLEYRVLDKEMALRELSSNN